MLIVLYHIRIYATSVLRDIEASCQRDSLARETISVLYVETELESNFESMEIEILR